LYTLFEAQPLVVFSPDDILFVLLFWSLFLPLDRTFALKKKPLSTNSIYFNGFWPYLGILLQIALIYGSNALTKTGDAWQNGYAVSMLLSDTMLRHNFFSDVLLSYQTLCGIISYLVKYIEALIFFLLLSPFHPKTSRFIAGLLIISLHFSFNIFVDVGEFHWVLLSAALLLIPSYIWNKILPNHSKNISSAPPILFTPIRIQYFLIKVLISFSIVGISLCSLNTIQKKNIFIAEIISRKLVKKATNLYTSNNYTTLLFKQPWAYFSINPPKQIGYITLIGVQKNKQLIDISTIQPFSNSTINPIKFEGFWQKIFYLIKTNPNHVSHKIMLDPFLKRTWSTFLASHSNTPIIEIKLCIASIIYNQADQNITLVEIFSEKKPIKEQ